MNKIPDFVYKYQAINTYSRENLANAQIYFNAPQKFNDPFELILQTRQLTETNLLSILNGAEKDLNQKTKNPSFQKEKILSLFEGKVKKRLKEIREELRECRGCWCASTGDENNSPANILMWSHYADSHKGMCLAFKRNELEKKFGNEMRSVTYRQNPISLCPLCVIDECKCSDIFDSLFHKSKIWSYENEFRIFSRSAYETKTYDEALDAIYFGSEVDPSVLKEVCSIAQSKNKNIKFFTTSIKQNSYELEFKPYDYIL
ncbi:MAG: DUF2971 domain-containing protein [Proteobacteria bacterium]|nr:DUF2971 domain-containing protein [Pseudomonadota bacterium]